MPLNNVQLVVDAAQAAGEIGLRYFRKDPEVWTKGKDSPVSEADLAIDRYLHKTLLDARPDYGWLSEETEDNEERLSRDCVFIVDPIDGTRGFIQETENWVISIAIVEKGRPVVGVLYGPVLKKLYVAFEGGGATCNGEVINPADGKELSEGEFAIPARIADHIQEKLKTQMMRARHIHSLAYRIALVADGGLAGTIARPSAKDWDVAAADIILKEAGGVFLDLDGRSPVYNRPSVDHQWLIASGQSIQIPLKNALARAIEERD